MRDDPDNDRLGWLMGLYAENHERLRTVRDAGWGRSTFQRRRRARCGNHVIEQHRYTTELR